MLTLRTTQHVGFILEYKQISGFQVALMPCVSPLDQMEKVNFLHFLSRLSEWKEKWKQLVATLARILGYRAT